MNNLSAPVSVYAPPAEVTAVEPLPSNVAATLFPGQGVGINPLDLEFNRGNITVAFAGNPNAPGG